MGLFSFSGRKGKEVQTKSSVKNNAPKTPGALSSSTNKKIPAPSKEDPISLSKKPSQPKDRPRSADRPRSTSEKSFQIISRKDEIPQHSSVLTATGNPLELIPEWQKNYAVLLTEQDKKNVVIIVSTDVYKNSLDDDYLAITDRINRGGYNRTKKLLAKPEILAIIYEEGSSLRTVEDSQRAATKIQLDFDDLLREAVSANASDIHIEVRREEANVRFRKNGNLMHHTEWPVRYARTMAGVIYQVIADEKDTTFDEARPQDAIIDRELEEGVRIRVRLATIPAYPAGFDMIMRLLKMGQGGKRQSLDKLGYEKRHLSYIRRAVAKPVGAVIMAGTTGSGKSTSLNSMLGEKIETNRGKIKVITVEDPPEYLLIGSTQVPVVRSRSQAKSGDKNSNPFASVVRAAMRSDPDILMVGEVRDEASAELLIHAVQSGHQVFTTIHASGGLDIIPRLRSNGIVNDVLGGQNFISALMYQTLLPTVCPHCSMDFKAVVKTFSTEQDDELVERINKFLKPSLIETLRFVNHSGCQHCAEGITGRTVAAEVILPDAYMLKCFRDMQDTEAFMHYRHKGGKIALEHGLFKAFKGIADIRDVESRLDQITLLYEHDQSARVFANLKPSVNFQVGLDVFDEISLEEKIKAEENDERTKNMHEAMSELASEDNSSPNLMDSGQIDPEGSQSRQFRSKLLAGESKQRPKGNLAPVKRIKDAIESRQADDSYNNKNNNEDE